MKKLFCLVFIIIMLLGLSACGECSHESWLKADCTKPALCAQCGFTEGEPLGHAPSEASCTKAGICTLCGETVTEKLPHFFGTWKINGDEMSRTCAECKVAETVPTDREMCFEELLSGHWDYYVDPDNVDAFWAYGSDGPEFWPYARFEAEGSGMLTLPVEAEAEALSSYRYDGSEKELQSHELQWVYQGFEINTVGEDCYSFTLVFSDGAERPGLLRVTEYELLIELMPDGTNTITLFKPLYHQQALGGYWWHLGSVSNGEELIRETGFYFLELRPDRSFWTNMFGEEITGTWHVKPIMDSIGLGYSKPMDGGGVFQTTMALWYEKDGRMQSFMESFVLVEDGKYPNPISLDGTVPRMVFGYLEHVIWDEVDQRGMEALTTLPGTWCSESFMETHYREGNEKLSQETAETNEFYIDFAEDGSFSALIDQQYEGRYFMYSVMDNEYSDEDFAYITIYLMPDDAQPGKEIIRGEMYYYPDGPANAFRVYLQDNFESGGLKYSGVYLFRKT